MTEQKENKEFRHLVRVVSTDLQGEKALSFAMCKIKGISEMFANAVCKIAGLDPSQKTGYLTEEQSNKITEIIKNPEGIPSWMLNRKKDYDTGEDKHLITSDLEYQKDNDLKRLKMIKSYRGLRHQWKLTTRGQRTRANFRRSKIADSKKKKQLARKK
ncbi:MAG: 30S ribosomal protein S13 [Nanobdellota archaeon]